MKKNKNISQPIIRSVMFRIFTFLIFIFTLILYSSIAILIYLQYSGKMDIIYTESVTNLLVIFVLLLFVLGWFFSYILYIGIIKPVYETFNIVSQAVNSLSTQEDIDKDQILSLQDFINNSLLQLNKSSLTNKMNISLSTENYIKKLSDLMKQNEYLANSKKELAKLVDQLEDQKELLELEKAKTSAIIDSIPNGLLVTSRDGNIFLVNKELGKILDTNSDNLLGKFIYNIFPDMKVNTEYSKVKGSNYDINIFDYQSTNKKKNITIENTSNPIKLNNEVLGSVYVLRDTTQERATERAQKEFVSIASHQLRTPITSIKWNAESMLTSKNIDKEVLAAANDIYKETNRMEKLVNSLLNLSRIDLGKIKFNTKEIYLDQYIDSLVNTLKSEITSKGLYLEKNIVFQRAIINDPVYMDIILSNILYNAIKYTNKNGKVKINIHQSTDKILIEVSDTGIGIPKSQQSQIFSRLFRGDNARLTQPDGNGLGLYVVKKLVELMHGNVWFESQENEGTTFFIELPIDITK